MRVLIVDDHPIVASGCRTIFADEPIVLLEAADAESGERVFVAEHPDICVIDINLPTVSGFDWRGAFLARAASARIIMFSMNDDPVFAARAIEIGAKGYVSKTGDPNDLVEAIREVGKGEIPCRPRSRAHRLRGTCIRAEPAFQADFARDGDPASAQRGQEPLRDRLAGSLLLQDGRQHLVDHAPQAWRAHLCRAGAIGHRERRGVIVPRGAGTAKS